jgi:hypothetical protein
MPVVIDCECGKKLRVADEQAGKRVRCPSCKGVVAVPPLSRPASLFPSGESPKDEQPSSSRVTARKAAPADDLIPLQPDDLDFEKSRKRSRPPYRVEHDYEDKEPTRRQSNQALGSLLGGLAMMAGAVIWFVVGLAGGIIFFYPPILFCLGVAAFVRGMMGND